MSTLTIRQLDERTHARLRGLAAQHGRSVDLTCTRLVTQTGEHLSDVVGDGGFSVELLTAELDGDLLQRA